MLRKSLEMQTPELCIYTRVKCGAKVKICAQAASSFRLLSSRLLSSGLLSLLRASCLLGFLSLGALGL
jgi:hypothetical protein